MNTQDYPKNDEPPQRTSRDFFNTKRAIDTPDFLVAHNAKSREILNTDGPVIPAISEADIVALSSLPEQDCKEHLGRVFDATGKNRLQFEIANSVLSGKARSVSNFNDCKEKLEEFYKEELWNPINAISTKESIGERNTYSKIETFYFVLAAVVGGISEWFFQAGTLQGSGAEPYIGTRGFFIALFISFLSLLMTMGIKAFLNQVPKSRMPSVWRMLLILTLVLFVLWGILFVVNYQPPGEGEPFDNPIVGMAVKALQIFVVPLLMNMISLQLKKSSESFSRKQVNYDAESLAVGEEIGSMELRLLDVNKTLGHLNDAIVRYESSKNTFVTHTMTRISIVQAKIESNYLLLRVDMYASALEKAQQTVTPKLEVVR